MSDVTFTVTGVVRAVKMPLQPTPAKVSLQLTVGDNHTSTATDIPIPDDARDEVYRYVRETLPRHVLEHGHGGVVTVTVTIEPG